MQDNIDNLDEFDEQTEFELNETGKEFIQNLVKYDPQKSKMINKDDDWYFSDTEYITNSHLKILKEGGPERFKAFKEGLLPKKETKARTEGSSFHCMLFEPEQYEKRFFVFDDAKIVAEIGGGNPRATTKYKEWKAEQTKLSASKEILSKDLFDTHMRMCDKINSIPEVIEMIRGCLYEKIYTSSWNGIKLKMKGDCINPGNYYLDAKTTRFPATLENYQWEFKKYSTARQLAFYAQILGLKSMWILAVEKTYPFSVGLYEVTEATLGIGWQEAQRELEKYQKYFVKNPELLEQKLTMGFL